MIRARNPISSLVIAGFVAFAFSVAPVGLDDDFSLETKSAFAKGKGSGSSSSSGRGGSNRGGGNRGGSSSSSGSDVEFVKGSSNGKSQGQLNSQGQGVSSESAHDNHGSLASALGNLNAAHASPTALENAAPGSIVGLLAIYAQDVADYDPEMTDAEVMQAKQEALGLISNKSYDDPAIVDTEVVDAVDSLLQEYSDSL